MSVRRTKGLYRFFLVIGLVTAALTLLCSRTTFRLVDITLGGTRYEVWTQQARVGALVCDTGMLRGVWGGVGSPTGIRWRPQRARATIVAGPVTQTCDGLLLPVWSLGLGVAVIGAAVWRVRPTRPAPGQCPTCGYTLAGLPGATCPECGRTS